MVLSKNTVKQSLYMRLQQISVKGLQEWRQQEKVNGEVIDLRTKIDQDCELTIHTFQSQEGAHAFRHTTSHILAQAVKDCFRIQNLQSDRQLMTVSTMILTEKFRLQTERSGNNRKRDEENCQRRSEN